MDKGFDAVSSFYREGTNLTMNVCSGNQNLILGVFIVGNCRACHSYLARRRRRLDVTFLIWNVPPSEHSVTTEQELLS